MHFFRLVHTCDADTSDERKYAGALEIFFQDGGRGATVIPKRFRSFRLRCHFPVKCLIA